MIEIKSAHTLEEIREIFKGDRFATEACNAVILEADVFRAKVEMEILPIHRNAWGGVMGGAIFTLADFAMAVASNGYREECDTCGVDANIFYVKPPKGSKLFAEAKCVKPGKILSFYEVTVTDDLGTDVAHFSGKTYTMQKK